MKFPKVASVDLSQLPTDSSELTPQESYIFNTIFQPEIDAYNQTRMQTQNNNGSKQQQSQLQDPQQYQQLKEHQAKKGSKNNMCVKSRMLLSLMFVILIVIFSITPIPNTIGSMMKNSPMYFAIIVLVLFALSFMLFTRYIKI